jgi:hypothetical protein
MTEIDQPPFIYSEYFGENKEATHSLFYCFGTGRDKDCGYKRFGYIEGGSPLFCDYIDSHYEI